MQTTVQNQRAIRLGSVVCRVDGQDIGALENAKFEATVETLRLVAHNARLEPRKRVTEAKLSADAWEIDVTKLPDLDGTGDLTTVTASPQTVSAEILQATGSVATGESFILAHSNANKTPVSAVTLKNGSTTVPASDYSVIVVDGKSRIIYTGSGLTLSGVGLNIAYTYTPNSSVTYTVKDIIRMIGMYSVEFVNTDENGQEFTIGFKKGYNSKGIEWNFQSDEKLDEVMKYPLEFVAFPDGQNELFYITDEQAVL